MQVLNMDIHVYMLACCETPLWRQSRSEVLEVTEVVRSLADGSFSSSPGKRPSVICKMRQEQSCNSVCFASIPLYSGAAVDRFLISHLVQLHVGQAGSRAAGISLRVRHCVAVQSQQLLQRKLSSLQGGREGLKDSWLRKVAYRHNWHFNNHLHDSTRYFFIAGLFWWKNIFPSF